MNANELADELEKCIDDGSTDLVCVQEAATMLRQQQEQIDKLASIVALREMEIKELKIKLQMEFEYAERLLKEKKWEPSQ